MNLALKPERGQVGAAVNFQAFGNTDALRAAVAGMCAELIDKGAQDIHAHVEHMLKDIVQGALQIRANEEGRQFIQCAPYERRDGREKASYRSGTVQRSLCWHGMEILVSCVKTRSKALVPQVVKDFAKLPASAAGILREAWLRGCSSRDLESISEHLAGRGVSHTKIMDLVNDVSEEVLRWRNASLAEKEYAFLFFDGFFVSNKRPEGRATNEGFLIAMGVTLQGQKELLGFELAPSESREAWERLMELLISVKKLNMHTVKLVVTDGSRGLIQALNVYMPDVSRQRCVLHKMKNIIGSTPHSAKGEVSDCMKRIWRSPNRATALAAKEEFVGKFGERFPRLKSILEDDFDATLAFYDFEPRLWKALRTTNVLERANRELRRKFREIGYGRGERAIIQHAAQLAIWLNREWEGEIVEGFKEKRKRRAQT